VKIIDRGNVILHLSAKEGKMQKQREQHALKVAKEALNTLQSQLSLKEDTIKKYQDMIVKVREEKGQQREVGYFLLLCSFLFKSNIYVMYS
jgi:hypothetical protein